MQQQGIRLANRPTERPPRRADILQSAMELLSVQLPDAISVADLTAQTGMTTAAFHRHFSDKDDLINELVATLAKQWSQAVNTWLTSLRTTADLPEFMARLIGWLDKNERPATVYFVTSVAATEESETIRRQTRTALHEQAIGTLRRIWPAGAPAEIAVSGIALVALLEVVARARLQLDESYRALGPVRFQLAAASLARGLVERVS